MRDVDDVENAERDRDAGGDRRVESAEHQPRDDGVDQQVLNLHGVSTGRSSRAIRRDAQARSDSVTVGPSTPLNACFLFAAPAAARPALRGGLREGGGFSSRRLIFGG